MSSHNALHAVVVKEPMRWHCSVTAVRNSRRFPRTCHHCHCQRWHTAKLKVIADAPISQSCHSHWGGRCAVLPSQSWRCQEFEEIANVPPLSSSRRLRTKSKEISDAPTLQSRHRCWGGFCTVLSSQSHRRQEFEENERCGRSRQQPIQQRDFRHEQEEVTNKKLTERVRTEEVHMGRHDKQHIADTWEWNITTINNREIGEDGNSGQVTSQNW